MTKRPPDTDPFADREAEKYEQPIPSREFILDLLEQAEMPMNRNQITKALALKDYQAVEALRRRLKAMERDGQILRNRKGAYGIVTKMDLIRGRVQAHRDGYGFLIPADGGEDLYLGSRQMSTVFDGDEVLCRAGGIDHRGKQEAVIVEVLVRNTKQLVGRLFDENGVVFVQPDNARIGHDIMVPRNLVGDASVGQYVMVEITGQPGWRTPPTGRVVEVIGEHMAPGMEIDVAIRTHDIPHTWSEAAEREAQALDPEPLEADKQHRVDLRKLPFVTIDGEDARDFDDAVYCEAKLLGGWRLWVAIADVSHYVKVGSALDQEANLRGTSVYFPERVVPMLPEALSNGLCSLKPKVDRLCMVCEMTISRSGKLTGYQFYEGVIHSHARLTYTKVGAILDDKHPDHRPFRIEYKDRVPDLEQLHRLYFALRGARAERGAIDFETTETRIVFGRERKIDTIVPVVRNDAHKLIEECMLAANVATARFLEKHKLPALFRVHEGPTEEKLETLREFLGELGLSLAGRSKPGPEHYQQLLASIEDRPDAHIIQTMMLRSLRQAVYQPENLGHFGLNYPAYAHFTSPIRRYPDLLVHRAIRHLIRSERPSKYVKRVSGAGVIPQKQIFPYDFAAMVSLGEHCSMCERRADDATRDVVAWLKCEYLQDRVGDEFDGVVSAVTGFGLFVELVDVYVEGLVHVSALDSDYYHFDPSRQRLVGERSGAVFQLGDAVRVQVARVSLEDKKIDLEMVSGATRAQRRAARASLHKSTGNKSAGEKTGGRNRSGGAARGRKPKQAAGAGKGKATGAKPKSTKVAAQAPKQATKKAPKKATANTPPKSTGNAAGGGKKKAGGKGARTRRRR